MSAWDSEPDRLALLELWGTGRLYRRKSQDSAWRRLDGQSWTRLTPRAGERETVDRMAIARLLDIAWPGWDAAWERLQSAGLPPTPDGWRTLLDRERIAMAPTTLPVRLNQRTAMAVVGPDSKAVRSGLRQQALAQVELTNDQILRLRAPEAMTLVSRRGDEMTAKALSGYSGEVIVSDRSIRDGLRLGGVTPRLVLTVENLGAYIDLPAPADWLIVHIPGWNTTILGALMALLPPDIAWTHWGDIDPNGLRIVRSLRQVRTSLRPVAPDWWADVAIHQSEADWSDIHVEHNDPRLFHLMAERGTWLEQEPITLDERLVPAVWLAATAT